MGGILKPRFSFGLWPVGAAVLVVGLAGCSSSSDAAFDIAAPSATQTPLPAVPSPAPTATVEPSPTPTPVGVNIKVAPLTTNEPFSWPEKGMENVDSDNVALGLRTLIEFSNILQFVLGDSQTGVHLDHPAWLSLRPYMTDGLVEIHETDWEETTERGSFDPSSQLSDFRVESYGDAETGEMMRLWVCKQSAGSTRDSDGAEPMLGANTVVKEYSFFVDGPVPLLDGYRPIEIVSETEMVECPPLEDFVGR